MAGLLIDSALQESLEILVGKHRDVNPMAHCRTTVVRMQMQESEMQRAVTRAAVNCPC
jgi:hypothetical protein